jgi:hypothetical protein
VSDNALKVHTPADTPEAIRAMVRRAQAGDGEAVKALRDQFAHAPEGLVKLAGGDLARMALDRAYTRAFGSNQRFFEVGCRAKLQSLRESLEGEQPTPIESMVIDSILLAWFQAHVAAIQADQAEEKRDADFFERRHERAHRRMMHALKSLAHVRRLNVGSLLAAIQQNGDNATLNVAIKG